MMSLYSGIKSEWLLLTSIILYKQEVGRVVGCEQWVERIEGEVKISLYLKEREIR